MSGGGYFSASKGDAVTQPQQPAANTYAGEDDEDEGGDSACWAHLLCPECGAVTGGEHGPGCSYVGDPRR